MTKSSVASPDLPEVGIPIKLQRDKDGQFFDLPKGWKFTNNKATVHKVESGLVLMTVRPGKLKSPQSREQAAD